jgi:NAD(P)-dependent dehydrogenase (short-subunit alcohol dehydrogenase family)
VNPSNLFDVRGKVALVTGASSGLGNHFARTLAANGATVVAAARRADKLGFLVDDILKAGGKAIAIPMDVTRRESVASAIAEAGKSAGAPDIVVNNAGIAQGKASLELTEDDWRSVLDTNLDGAWRVAQESAKAMIAAGKGGSIINIASVLGIRVANSLLAYATAKAALIQATKALALEWARYRIRVNAIAPGYIETPIAINYWNTFPDPEAEKRRAYELHPPKRVGRPEEVAWTAVFLASDEAPFINAETIVIDGGRSVLYHD